jgi:importin subunit beta-1
MNQNNPNILSQILENALSYDKKIREQAENQINKLVDSNFEEFIFNISQKISNEYEKKESRQLCSTLIKNIVTNPKYSLKWFEMAQETKQQIKNHILAGLASEDRDISKGVGIAIAGICKIELPKQQWNEIFPNLIRTSQNENINIQLTSVITLGFIFTEIGINDINDDTIANLLNSFYTLLNNDNLDVNLHIQSLKALCNFLPFIGNIISNQNQKNIFLDLVYKSVINANENIRKEALEIFLELIRQYYESFDDYYEKLVYFTTNIMKNDIEGNKIYAYEIWCTIGDI